MTDATQQEPDIDAILDDADFATDEVPICLKGSLLTEWGRADEALEQANLALKARQEQGGNTAALAADRDQLLSALQDVEARMKAASITFKMTAIATHEYNAIILQHPPRDGAVGDGVYGFDTSKAFPALIHRCMLSPVLSDAQWAKLQEKLTDRQWDSLAGAVIRLNRATDGSIPFSLAASEAILSSDGTSKSPSDSASVRSVSGAGSQRQQPRKKAPKAARGKSSGTPSNGS